MTTYLIDSNIFIQGMKHHYSFEFSPAFWNWLIAQNNAARSPASRKSKKNSKRRTTY